MRLIVILFIITAFPSILLELCKLKTSLLKTCLKKTTTKIVLRNDTIGSEYLEFCDHVDFRLNIRPKGFLLPSNEKDVQKIVKCAALWNVRITVKCGGHNLEGFSYGSDNHFVVYMKKFDQTKIDLENGTVKVVYTIADFPTVFPSFQKFCEENPDEAVNLSMYYSFPTSGTLIVLGSIVRKEHICDKQLIDDIKTRFPNFTINDFVTQSFERTYSAVQYKVDRRFWKSRTFFVEKRFTKNDFDMMRGKISRMTKGAWIHRNAYYSVVVGVGVPEAVGIAEAKSIGYASLASIDAFILTTKNIENGRSYQNYVDNNRTDWKERYYGEHYPLLQQIKNKYDPSMLFRCKQCFNLTNHVTCPLKIKNKI
ncbi:dehydrogenase-like protein [Leptotrombidium deliense]|uniref:Dehydrogenase-like protein n=1 Tax=Leptotrombidium deliense TaxID=299467 RepID=A0A443SG84_9ACAR|nr:dehydrogenase-like protein [Leptotrombidium deliense]